MVASSCRAHSQGADALVDVVLAKGLRSKETLVGFPEQHLHRDRLRAWIIASVRIRVEVDFLVIAVAEPL